MAWRALCKRILSVVIGVMGLLASPALAEADPKTKNSLAPSCHGATDLDVSLLTMAEHVRSKDGWTCDDRDWRADEPVAWLLFERSSWNGENAPRYFFSRIARHESITFGILDQSGRLQSVKLSEADAQPVPMGPMFRHTLPALAPETQAVVVRIERPHSVPLLTEARLVYQPDDVGWSEYEVILVAFVLGMLVLPLFFDLSFYVVLRERFVLLHAVMVIAMMGYVLSAGGLIAIFPHFSLRAVAVAGPVLWAIGVGTSALFLAEFLEERAQSPFMRRLTIATGAWAITVPGFFGLQLHATQSFDDRGYFLAFLPVILVVTVAVAEAVMRGSRSARFIALAWTPIILASIDRLLRGLGVYVGPSSFDLTMYVATGVEVIIMSLAIADRFLAIRRERDEAVTEARTLERLSERDALTGLLNRRGLESRFEHLFKNGFDTFALIDLDGFKQVNDRYGHQMGDAALVACARALESHQGPDLTAARLGGEEFVVLLRGDNALQRAEALRQAIPARIAADVPGLGIAVNASSGAVAVPRSTRAMMNFDEFYARADALMYDAKASGRNRMVSEKITIFQKAAASGVSNRALPTPANSDQAA